MIWKYAWVIKWEVVESGLDPNRRIYTMDGPDQKRERGGQRVSERAGSKMAVRSKGIDGRDPITSEKGREPNLQWSNVVISAGSSDQR